MGRMDAVAATPLLPLVLLVVVALLAVLAPWAQSWLAERRRARLRAAPFPAPWRRILRQRVPIVARLPPAVQLRLKQHIQVFIAEKPFIGCRGQSINDEVRVTVAALACLLMLGHAQPDLYPRLREVLIYPDAFVADRELTLPTGLVQHSRQAMAGESWSRGQVILSWADVLRGAADPADGSNVVIHEFAHQVDQDTGAADGQPWRPTAALRQRWASVMGQAFERLRREPSALIDAYGATDPAEFFAVASEVFFERPLELAAEAPTVYAELSALYGLNPADWALDQPARRSR